MAAGAVALLETEDVSRRFGGVLAVDRVRLAVAGGEIFGLIGANGAGKTTLFNLITGFIAPSGGRIRLAGEDVTRRPAWDRVRRGMARTFQTPQLFPAMSVRDNVMSGTYAARLALTRRARARFRADRHGAEERCERLLDLVGLASERDTVAAELPYGLQRKLEIARALMTDPLILMLDEPAAGMLPREADELNGLIRRIRDGGCTVLVVEHNMRVVMNVSDRVAVMEFGRIIATGTPAEVRSSPDVIRAYLGEAH